MTTMANYLRIWKYPALLATLTLFGLISALVGSGVWHYLAWISLIIPVGVAVYFCFAKTPRNP